jgi:hypothetical protein
VYIQGHDRTQENRDTSNRECGEPQDRPQAIFDERLGELILAGLLMRNFRNRAECLFAT